MNNWFTIYCNMTEDEKYLYEEFEMDDICKTNLKTYKRLYEVVRLMSLDYEHQIMALPKGINVAEEIALLFEDEVIAVLGDMHKYGLLSLENCEIIIRIQNKLSQMTERKDENLWTLEALKHSSEWEKCRREAKSLLTILFQLE